jgi:hypothetical protein
LGKTVKFELAFNAHGSNIEEEAKRLYREQEAKQYVELTGEHALRQVCSEHVQKKLRKYLQTI